MGVHASTDVEISAAIFSRNLQHSATHGYIISLRIATPVLSNRAHVLDIFIVAHEGSWNTLSIIPFPSRPLASLL